MKIHELPHAIRQRIQLGAVIPAHPLALHANRTLDERRQRALTRYYLDAGAGGVAVGVHTTQFAIRKPEFGLLKPVLELAAETIRQHDRNQETIRIAGICGRTEQALREAALALELGYHAGLLSLSAFAKDPVDIILNHCREITDLIPVWGFYLQPAVGGRILSYHFWRRFFDIENVIAVKIAPFNRYQTLDVIRALCDAGRETDIALYTGNDDTIVNDLLTTYRFNTESGTKLVRIVGGLLGHWAVWTHQAVAIHQQIQTLHTDGSRISPSMLTLGAEVTDANAAFFDAANQFAGCIAGIHEVLRRQGLLEGIWCLEPSETLSPGQAEEIDRVYRAYPHLNDDAFVRERLSQWLSE